MANKKGKPSQKLDSKQMVLLVGGAVVLVVLVILIAVMLLGNKKEQGVEPEETPEETVVVEEPEEVVEDENVSLLTGLPLDEEYLTKRPISIMIENTKPALPQYGLNSAGVIYEAPMEGGLTRFMAIFDANIDLEKIGNMRSARPYFVYTATEFDSIFAHIGQSVHAENLLNTGIIDDLNGVKGDMANTFYRTSDRNAPHNTYTSAEKLFAAIEQKGYRDTYKDGYTGHYVFAPASEPETLDAGEDIAVIAPYFYDNKPYFIYNEETGTYDRYEYGSAEIDAVDGKQISVKNIIFQSSEVASAIYGGTQYVNFPLNGKGVGKYFTNGKMIDITWEKESDTAVARYYDASGNEIKLNRGQTWVCLIELQHFEENNYYKTEDDFNNR